jgi:hypothetical protein
MILLTMIFLHIINDYNLQGWLASAKQKQWWIDNAPQEKYRCDYICALLMHSFSWTFMVMLPLTLIEWGALYQDFAITFGLNFIIHAVVDHMKANVKLINLLEDQAIHLIQIIATYWILFC